MAITETLKKLVGKVLSIGTPPEKEVLYREVIKRKAPQKSAEGLLIDDIKNNIKKIWTPKDSTEFKRNIENPPAKKAVKKSTSTKNSTSKKSATKKSVTKKTTKKIAEAKKATTTKKASTSTSSAKKAPAQKAPAKKTSTKKSEVSKKTTTTKGSTTAKKSTPSKKTTTKKPAAKKETTKTETTKKAPAKKTVTKKTVSKKAETKTEIAKTTTSKKVTTRNPATKRASTSSKKAPAAKGSKRDEKIALYVKDIKKHYGEVDEAFVAIVVKNLGPSIYRRDAELVSCSDPKELNTVRRNFLMKKLGIEASQGVLDAAIQDVCTELKGVRTKYRATFYYALAKKFKKESVLS